MSDTILRTVCCSGCGAILSKSYGGTKSYVHCPKCHAELYYEVDSCEAIIRIIKEPKNPTTIPKASTN